MKKLTDENIETQAKFTLKNNLSAVSKVNADDLNLLLDKFELVSYIKNTEIIKEGDIAEYFYFIYKGIIKIYFFIYYIYLIYKFMI